jgi:hypothetical protein
MRLCKRLRNPLFIIACLLSCYREECHVWQITMLLNTEIFPGSGAFSKACPSPSVYVGEHWLDLGGENILWPPSEYRPSVLVVHGGIVGFRCTLRAKF